MARVIRTIGASIGVAVCFFYLGCGSIQVANASAGANTAPLTIATKLLPSAITGTPYVVVLDATGGTPNYTWGVTSGRLPLGMSLTPASGIISGTPTTSGNFSVGVTLSDASNPTEKRTSTITIAIAPAALAIVASALPSATSGTSYSQVLQANGGTPAYVWSITSGNLPAGLKLGSSTGLISGIPIATGSVNFGVSVRDNERPAKTQSIQMSLAVTPSALKLLTSTVPSAIAGAPYSQVLLASGGKPVYKWLVVSGNLAQGLSLDPSTGTISGVPTVAGISSFTASVSDNSSPVQAISAPIAFTVAPSTLKLSASALPSATVGTAYSQNLGATGGTTPYLWSIAAGKLSDGLVLNPSTGSISGTPTSSGTSTFTATVADAGKPTQSVSAATSVLVQATRLVISPVVLPAVKVGAPYSQVLQAGGGTPPYRWSIAAGNLPGGLSLAPSTGTISGTPTVSGTATFTAAVTDSGSPTQSAQSTSAVVVSSTPLVITSSALPAVTAGAAYTQTLQANGGSTPYTWAVTSGKLPGGLTLGASSGTISGIATTNGTSSFTMTVTDSSSPGQVTSVPAAITVAGSTLTITTVALPSDTNGTAYSQILQAIGGTAPYAWSITSGQLPGGLSLSPSTGVISGIATTSGVSTFAVTVIDSSSPLQTKSAAFTIAASASSLSITSSYLASATTGGTYSQTLQASGGTPAYTWSITSGNLPTGLTLAATTGLITGSPTTAGTSIFTATVSDNGNPAQRQSAATSITVTATQPSGPGSTWYVRPDGGTRYSVNQTAGQCDGTADVSYASTGGAGVNQHCAFNDVRYLWTDKSYTTDEGAGSPKWGWIGSGGDTYLIHGGPWRVGQSGPDSTDWFGLAGDPFGSGAPPPLSGTASAHTRILGENYGACTSQSARTQIFGGFAAGNVLSMSGASYVDVACLDISDHSSCGRAGQANGCATSYPLSDFATNGIGWSNTATNDTLTDVRIHGMAEAGMLGPTGTGMVFTDVQLLGNASSGWNADAGNGKTGSGTLLMQKFEVSWNGCTEEYPIVDALPYTACTDDNGGGYGDGIGTASAVSNPPWVAHFDQGVISYNTQDGLDTLHLTGGGSSVTATRILAYGNMGQQIKIGGAPGTAINNVVVANCNAMRLAIPGTPAGYNSKLSDFCRAADNGIALSVGKGTTLTYQFNTLYSANAVGVELLCDITAGPCDSTSLVDFRNNVFLGFANDVSDGYPGGGNQQYSNPIYNVIDPYVNVFLNPGSVLANNATYRWSTSGWTCANTNLNELKALCTDPQLTDETWHPYGYGNMAPMPGSTGVAGIGVPIPGATIDYTGQVRGDLPSIGAYQ